METKKDDSWKHGRPIKNRMDIQQPTLSTRETRPWTVAGTIGLPGGLGVDVGYQLHDRVQLSAHAASWVAVTDVGADVRLFPIAGERGGLYVATGVRGLIAPVLLKGVAPGINAEIGGEFRARNGFTIAGGIGGIMAYYPPGSEGGGDEWGVIPTLNLRIGKSF